MRLVGIIFAATVVGLSVVASAQIAATQPAERGMGARGRNFSAAQMQRIQDAVGATDDEWKVIQPRIEKIESLRRGIQNSRFGLRGRRGNATGAPAGAKATASPVVPPAQPVGDQTELQLASQQLQEALNNKDTQPRELKDRLAALRAARAHALEEFTKAQDDLREFLTARQEAALVTLGLLS